jgi:hypothetical protein
MCPNGAVLNRDKFALLLLLLLLLLLYADTAVISVLVVVDKGEIYERKHGKILTSSINMTEHYQSVKRWCYFSDILYEIRTNKM